MITFVTSDDGRLDFAELTRESKRSYCEEHGYAFFYKELNPNANPYWGQVPAMQESLESCDGWINYTGADAYIVPGAGPCEHLLDDNFDLIISKDENGLNNNGFFLKNSEWGRTFLAKVWALRSDKTIAVFHNGDGLVAPRKHGMPHEWFEQAAFIVVLRKLGLDRVKFVPQELINAYPLKGIPGAFIEHLPNTSNEERLEFIKERLHG